LLTTTEENAKNRLSNNNLILFMNNKDVESAPHLFYM
jgi:hypothetical protein